MTGLSLSFFPRFTKALSLGGCSLGIFLSAVTAQNQAPNTFVLMSWGRESLNQIDRDFWMNPRRLYADEATAKADARGANKRAPAFMWGCGVQLSALAAAAKLDRMKYGSRLRQYAMGLDGYWQESNGVGGYDVLPTPKPADRYYDDNAWVVLAMLETYEATGDKAFLRRAEKTMAFVLSGEDQELGGGIYWREAEKKSKNTCTNAPAIVAALRLYQITKDPRYLAAAERVYAWTCKNLQDADGLFFDNIALNGDVARFKLTYNSGLMLRANVEFYRVTKDPKYRIEAERIADASLRQWFTPEGGIKDSGRFAHLLLGGLIELNRVAPSPKWRQPVEKTLAYVHDRLRDPAGRYPGHWDKPPNGPVQKFNILDEASVARAYWEAAAPFPK